MKEKNHQKGFIQIPLLIIIIASIIVASAGTGVVLYRQGKLTPIVANISEVFKGAEPETKQDLEAQKEVVSSQLLDEGSQKRITELEQKIKELEEKTKNPPQSQQEREPQRLLKTLDLATIIKLWKPYIAYIECDFVNTNEVKYLTQVGSGWLLGGGSLQVYTNKHVLLDRDKYTPDACRVFIPKGGNIFSASLGNIKVYTGGLDFGYINITNPDYISQYLDYSEISEYQDIIFCNQKASLGDEVVILGYPGIGSQTDITATRGIISGYDGDYYITDTKVEQGNSGGAAILLKNNCYLGIPTFAKVGSVESLARILDFNAILNY